MMNEGFFLVKDTVQYCFKFNFSGFIAAVSARGLGNMSLSYSDTANSLRNRHSFLETLGINPKTLVCSRQAHSGIVAYVNANDAGRGAFSDDTAIEHTDALITDVRSLPLAVFTADCPSIFIFAPSVFAAGIIHAGWRGTRECIVSRTIERMKDCFNVSSNDIYAVIGPAIRKCCYEVGGEFSGFFPEDMNYRQDRCYLDLIQANRRQLLNSGVKHNKIFDSGFCTFCMSEDFFSYRRQGPSCGRMMSVIMVK